MQQLLDRIMSLSGQVETWILGVADAWWIHLVVFGFAAADGFFPSVPSESTIVTLASLWSSAGQPAIVLVGLAAWLGAWAGDNLGYLLGRTIGWQRFRFLREGKGRAAVEAADRGLQRRALLFLMTARYIPFGRTAVNLVAGAVHYPHRNFWPRSLLSTFVWAVYSCAIGAIAGSWFADNHLLAITVALVAAVLLAVVAERIINAIHKVLDRRAEKHGNAVVDRLVELAEGELAEQMDPAESEDRPSYRPVAEAGVAAETAAVRDASEASDASGASGPSGRSRSPESTASLDAVGPAEPVGSVTSSPAGQEQQS
ncbi:VTT domain-containing protein [Brachybacterium sp. DNPG3]